MATIQIGDVTLQLVTRGKRFLGIGRVKVGATVVRSGELPMRPYTQTFDGLAYDDYEIIDIKQTAKRLVIETRALATAAPVHVRLDHSLDPIWSSRPWDGRTLSEDRVDWIFAAESRQIGGRSYDGFSYHFAFRSAAQSIFYLLDRATWELGGRAEGITLLRQQMGGDPKATLRARTAYSTSGCIGFPLNPVMTFDVPRWASEQGFDYQYRDGTALIGLFDRTALIRTIVERAPGESVVRHFDKHIFDETSKAETMRKFIGVGHGIDGEVGQVNAWTAVFDADQDNVLGEFGMHRPTVETVLSHNFWVDFTAESYRQDVLPAAAALQVQKVFIDPFWENDATRYRDGTLQSHMYGNMCCPHEYEVGRILGGVKAYKRLAKDFRAHGIELQSWIGSHQSIHSPLLAAFKGPHWNEVIRQPDGRHWWKSGYESILGMDLTQSFGPMFRDQIIKAVKATGIRRFLYDSFFNFGFMPVNYYQPDPKDPNNTQRGRIRPHTQWRALLEIMAAWQQAGLAMTIESLGPWGQGQHGVQGRYDAPGAAPLAYQCSVSIGYSVIPAGDGGRKAKGGPDTYYRFLANKAPLALSLRAGDKRLDQLEQAAALRQANQDYRAVAPLMHTRTLLPDGKAVAWQPQTGSRQAVFALRRTTLPLAGKQRWTDVTTGESGVAVDRLALKSQHTYIVD